MKTTLYLVRHGTTELNERFCYQGQTDIPLSDIGMAQGALLTDYFKDIPIDIGVTSPLKRARQTLDFILGERRDKVPIIVAPGIVEMNQGVAEARTLTEIDIMFPTFSRDCVQKPGQAKAPGGETGKAVYERMRDAVLDIVKKNPGKTIAMASHGFSIQTFLNYAKGIPPEEMTEMVLDNVAVSKFTFDETGKITICYIGDSSHLTPEYTFNYDFEALMKTKLLFLHYPRCSTCRKARKYLDAAGVAYVERDLVADPLNTVEIEALMAKTDAPDKKFFNTSGVLYREQKLKDHIPTMTHEQIVEKLAEDGKLVKRPLLVRDDGLCIGFKEKEWDEFIKDLD